MQTSKNCRITKKLASMWNKLKSSKEPEDIEEYNEFQELAKTKKIEEAMAKRS